MAITWRDLLDNLLTDGPERGPADALCLVELRGFEPLTPCMPRYPHQLTTPSAALLGTASALPRAPAGQGAVVRREAACGSAADNLLTGRKASAVGSESGNGMSGHARLGSGWVAGCPPPVGAGGGGGVVAGSEPPLSSRNGGYSSVISAA
jgi:hypothetical protein